MLESIVILMCTCGKPEVLYLQEPNEINIAAYGTLGFTGEMDKMFRALCTGNEDHARKDVIVWHLDQMNGRQCPVLVRRQ